MVRLFDAAVARRMAMMNEKTNAWRLMDGAGDGIEGVVMESFADRWLVSTTANTLPDEMRRWLEKSGRSCYHKWLDSHQKESPKHVCGPVSDDAFLILETGMQFEISFQSGYSQGLFLDQRMNRAALRKRVNAGQRVLNTFAYTGAFSVAAALGGAETTTLDLSQPYLDWAKRNFSHNQLDSSQHHFCKGDAFHWLRRFAKQGRKFDGVVLDPPTFSRDDQGRVFRVEQDFGELAKLAMAVLAPAGWLLCCTNFRGMSERDFHAQLSRSLPRGCAYHAAGMPDDFTDEPYLKTYWVER